MWWCVHLPVCRHERQKRIMCRHQCSHTPAATQPNAYSLLGLVRFVLVKCSMHERTEVKQPPKKLQASVMNTVPTTNGMSHSSSSPAAAAVAAAAASLSLSHPLTNIIRITNDICFPYSMVIEVLSRTAGFMPLPVCFLAFSVAVVGFFAS